MQTVKYAEKQPNNNQCPSCTQYSKTAPVPLFIMLIQANFGNAKISTAPICETPPQTYRHDKAVSEVAENLSNINLRKLSTCQTCDEIMRD